MSVDPHSTPKAHFSYMKRNKWKISFFSLVFTVVVGLNLIFAPMMQECSDILIAAL